MEKSVLNVGDKSPNKDTERKMATNGSVNHNETSSVADTHPTSAADTSASGVATSDPPEYRHENIKGGSTLSLSSGDQEEQEDEAHDDDASQQTQNSSDLERAQSKAASTTEPVYSVFSGRAKVFVVAMAASCGFISPFSANIYYPSLNIIASEYNVSYGVANLTLTTYLIFQGLAPTFFGDLADMAGRRPAFIVGMIVYVCACVGIATQHSFAALLVLRMLQSTGSSSTIALANGVAADVSTPAERGSYVGFVSSGYLLGPAIGPVIGGLLSQELGWRWIFWFLAILGGALLVLLLTVFPETGRNVVGDGSIPPQTWNMSLLSYLAVRKQRKALESADNSLSRKSSHASLASARDALKQKRRLRIPNPLNTVKIVRNPDVLLLLVFNCIVFAAFYDVTASLPKIFQETYGFDSLKIGLCCIPLGVGGFLAPLANGRMLDWNFRRVAKQAGIEIKKGRATPLRNFPLERARFQVAFPLATMGCAALLTYGWIMEYNAPLAAPLVVLFFVGFGLTCTFNVMSVVLVDYYPLSPSTAVAGNNLFRCLVGAAGTAVISYMIDGMGRGWCFTLLSLLVFFCTSILAILMKYGPGWREQRYQKQDETKAREEEEKRMREDETDRGEKGDVQIKEMKT